MQSAVGRGKRRRGRADLRKTGQWAIRCIYPETTSAAAAQATPAISSISPIPPSAMDAFRLRKKYPEVSQDEMLDLINRFKYVRPSSARL